MGYVGLGFGLFRELLEVGIIALVMGITLNFGHYLTTLLGPWLGTNASTDFCVVLLFFLILCLASRILIRSFFDTRKLETKTTYLHIGGLLVGLFRAACWSGFLLLFLASSEISVLHNTVSQSIIGRKYYRSTEKVFVAFADVLPGSGLRGKPMIPSAVR